MSICSIYACHRHVTFVAFFVSELKGHNLTFNNNWALKNIFLETLFFQFNHWVFCSNVAISPK